MKSRQYSNKGGRHCIAHSSKTGQADKDIPAVGSVPIRTGLVENVVMGGIPSSHRYWVKSMDGPGEIFALRNFTTSLIAGAGEPHQLVRKISHESPSKFHITEKLKKKIEKKT